MIDDPERFDEALSQSVEGSLKKILGEMAGEALLRQLERQHSLNRKDVPTKLERFARVLEDMLGCKSAALVGNFMVREFYLRLGLKYERTRDPSHWVDYLIEARRNVSADRGG